MMYSASTVFVVVLMCVGVVSLTWGLVSVVICGKMSVLLYVRMYVVNYLIYAYKEVVQSVQFVPNEFFPTRVGVRPHTYPYVLKGLIINHCTHPP